MDNLLPDEVAAALVAYVIYTNSAGMTGHMCAPCNTPRSIHTSHVNFNHISYAIYVEYDLKGGKTSIYVWQAV